MNTKITAEKIRMIPLLHNIDRIRSDFPILSCLIHSKPLVYLDNAATSQKPRQTIEAMDQYYREYNSNIHRGVHTLSEKATSAYEKSRIKVSEFINARSTSEIIFTRGTTESINLIAQSYGRFILKAGDEIIISEMEHHSNIVPWQILCKQIGVVLRVIPINDKGELILEEFRSLLGQKTKLVSIGHVSNALGTVNPVKQIIDLAHAHGAVTVLDGAQAAPHCPVDVQDIDCDFYCFSSHKLYGPTGIGILCGKQHLLEEMCPYQGGGDMIKTVTFKKTTYSDLPYKFEAGTPNIAGVIGIGAAIDYVNNIGMKAIAEYENYLLEYATGAISTIKDLKLIGTAKQKAAILSFIIKDIHPHDIGTILDHEGIAIRTGHHCAMPIMDKYGVPATARASFSFYNTTEEIDKLIIGIEHAKEVFS